MTPLAAPTTPALPHDWQRRLLLDTRYTVIGLPYGLIGFVLLVAGFSVGVALLVTVLGLPILTGTCYLARGLATGERRALATVTDLTGATVSYRRAPAGAGWWRRISTPFTDSQYWLDFGHGLLALPTSIIAFAFTVVWWAGALGGLSYPLWSWSLPNDERDQRLPELLGAGDSVLADNTVTALLGLVFLVTLPPVVRGAALVRAVPARAMLLSVAGLRQRISGLEEARATAEARTATAQEQRAAAVSAEATALRRLERDIHDGPQQRLVRLAMDLGRARHQLDVDPAAARDTVTEALAQTRETLHELRALSRGIAPPILADRGLAAAVAALAGRSTVPVDLDAGGLGRTEPAVESAAYFVIAECLTNVAKHSRATECAVALRRTATTMVIDVRDNGVGGAHLSKGHGLAGLADRVRAVGGTLRVDSPEGGPTTVTAELPCGS